MGGLYLSSQFGVIFLPLAAVQVRLGDTLRVTCRYSHYGAAEDMVLYAAIGNHGWAGFDEVLKGSRTVSVPEDLAWTYREDYVDIAISSSKAPGFYDLYGKIDGGIPRVTSPVLQDVVEMLGAVSESEFGEIAITGYAGV